MTWPVDDIATGDLDAQTDTPPRAMFLRMAQRMKSMLGARGAANGVCDLDAAGRVPAARLGGANVAGAPVRLDSGSKVPAAQLPQASEAAPGAVEFASAAEANALARLDRAVAPGRIPRASGSQAGVVEIATGGEVEAGTAGDLAVSPLKLRESLGFTKSMAANYQAFTRDRERTISLSGLGGPPILARFWLLCAIREHGYAVGDRVFTAPGLVHVNRSGTDEVYGFQFTVDADRRNARLRIAKNGIRLLPKTAGNSQGVAATDANWRMEIQLWG